MILITGATGVLGACLVPLLRGADAHALSRAPRTGGGIVWHVGDLAEAPMAVGKADVIIHLATEPRSKGSDLAQAQGLLRAARPDSHLVYISIVGVDRHPYAYYKEKYEVEKLIEKSGNPFSILRTTQFHNFVVYLLDMLTLGPVMVIPSGTSVQPVAVEEVAVRLAELALGAPAGRVPDLGGPEILPTTQIAHSYLRSAANKKLVLPIRLPGKVARAFRDGLHLAQTAGGKQTFTEYLETR